MINHKITLQEKPSLRRKLIIIIMISWVLPVLLVVGVTGYYIINNINKKIVNTITTSVNNSIQISANNINSAVSDSRNASYYKAIEKAYQAYKNNHDSTLLYDNVTKFLSSRYKYDSKYLATMLFFIEDPDTVYYTYNDTYSKAYSEVIKYQKNYHENIVSLSKNLETDIGYIYHDNDLFMIRNLLDKNFDPYAVLIMKLNINEVFGCLKNILYQTDIALILNETPIIISGKFPNLNDLQLTFPRNSNIFDKREKGSSMYGSIMTDGGQLSYIIKLDDLKLIQELTTFNKVLYGITILIIPLLLFAVRFFHVNVSKPTNKLIKASDQLESSNFGYQLEKQFDNKEFECLRNSFNNMSLKLRHQFDTIYSEELALRDARIMALQSQINPHFLNNTLEIINWEARMADNTKVSRMIESLSTMLDAAMDRNKKPLIKLSQELMYVDAYLYIISERLGSRISIIKEIDESLLDYLVPRLILQPIIENAVEHGITYKQQGIIKIHIYKNDTFIIIEVENNGELTKEDQDKINRLLSSEYGAKHESSGSLGISNVNQRLKILYGKSSGLSIKRNENNFVITRIIIPFNQTPQ